jgi:predicted lipid carrier protein YhbT
MKVNKHGWFSVKMFLNMIGVSMNLLKATASVPLRVMPAAVQAAMLTLAVNHLLSGQSLRSRLRELDGKSVSVRVVDVPWLMHFHIQGEQVRAVNHTPVTDVTVSGELQSFLQLLGGREDPDTLFFHRKLSVEGDTETGVHVKNLLDALEYDWDAHFDSVLPPPLANGAKRLRRMISNSPLLNRLRAYAQE